MTAYDDFRLISDKAFSEVGGYPNAECQLIATFRTRPDFWNALGEHLKRLDEGKGELDLSTTDRDTTVLRRHLDPVRHPGAIERDRHVQAIIDCASYLGEIQERSDLYAASLEMFIRHDLLRGAITGYEELSLLNLLADVGSGGVHTLTQWGILLAAEIPEQFEAAAARYPFLDGLLLVAHFRQDPNLLKVMPVATQEAVVWRYLNWVNSRQYQGIDIYDETEVVSKALSLGVANGFSGWSLLHVMDEDHLFTDIIEKYDIKLSGNPFGRVDLSLSQLVWENPASVSVKDELFGHLLANQQADGCAFAREAVSRSSWNTAPKQMNAIKSFCKAQGSVFLQIDLDQEGFKRAEDYGVATEILMKHPDAQAHYYAWRLSRELGL